MPDQPPPLPAVPTPAPLPKSPTVIKEPPAGRKFPCVKCGARLDFDPKAKSLQCPYCGHVEKIEKGQAGVQERDNGLDDDGTDARQAAAERGGQKEHHRPDDVIRERLADARGVRPDHRTRTPHSLSWSRRRWSTSRLKPIRNRTSSGERDQFSVENA